MRETKSGIQGMVTMCLVLGCLMLSGCWSVPLRSAGTVSPVVAPDFFGISDNVAMQLNANLRRPLGNGKRLIMTTLVNIDHLSQASRFGRTLSESLATRLFQYGFGVVEVRKAAVLLMKDSSGELMLTRDAKLLARQYEAEAVVAGTYALTPNSVIVNVKLLDASSLDVLSVAGLEVERTRNINHLLAGMSGSGEGGLSGYER